MYNPKTFTERTRREEDDWEETTPFGVFDMMAEISIIDPIVKPIVTPLFASNNSTTGTKATEKDKRNANISRMPQTDPLEEIKKGIATYLENNKGVLLEVSDLPLKSIFGVIYVKIEEEKKKSNYYKVEFDLLKQVRKINQEEYEISSPKDDKQFIHAINGKGARVKMYVSGKQLEEVTVVAYDTKRLEQLRQFAEDDAGFGGIFYNYPEEQAALLFASLNPVERKLISRDKKLLNKIGNKLDNAQFARGLEKLDFTLKEKLELLWDGRGFASGRGIEYQDLRGLLLNSGEEGKKLDNELAKAFGVNDILRIDFLLDKKLLQRFISSTKKLNRENRPSDLLFDDMTDDNSTTLTENELKVVNTILEKKKTISELSETEKNTYLKAFRRNALKVTFDVLELSEKSIIQSSNQLLKNQSDEILQELKKNKKSFERMSYLGGVSSASTIGDSKDTQQNKEFQRNAKASADSEKENIESELRGKLSEKFPILADPKIDLQDLYNDFAEDEKSKDLEHFLREHLAVIFENIQETKRVMREEPLQVYKLEGVIERTKLLMAMPSPIFDKIVDEKVDDIQWNEFMFSIGLGIVSIGLAIASFGTLSPLALSLLATTSFVVSSTDFYYTYQNYTFSKTTSNTSIDPSQALSFSDPSFVWVIASFAGAVADIATVAKGIKAASILNFAKTGEGAETIVAELKTMGVIKKGMSEATVAEMLEKARRFKMTVKEELLSLSKGNSVNLKEIDEIADIYMAEKFKQLDELGEIDDFVKKDLPEWRGGKKSFEKQFEATKSIKVSFNGNEVPIYRGGEDFTLKAGEFKINPETGMVKTTHGVSLDADANTLSRFGGAYQIESIPEGLKIIQRGRRLEHFEIVPSYEMSVEEFQDLLNKIKILPVK